MRHLSGNLSPISYSRSYSSPFTLDYVYNNYEAFITAIFHQFPTPGFIPVLSLQTMYITTMRHLSAIFHQFPTPFQYFLIPGIYLAIFHQFHSKSNFSPFTLDYAYNNYEAFISAISFLIPVISLQTMNITTVRHLPTPGLIPVFSLQTMYITTMRHFSGNLSPISYSRSYSSPFTLDYVYNNYEAFIWQSFTNFLLQVLFQSYQFRLQL